MFMERDVLTAGSRCPICQRNSVVGAKCTASGCSYGKIRSEDLQDLQDRKDRELAKAHRRRNAGNKQKKSGSGAGWVVLAVIVFGILAAKGNNDRPASAAAPQAAAPQVSPAQLGTPDVEGQSLADAASVGPVTVAAATATRSGASTVSYYGFCLIYERALGDEVDSITVSANFYGTRDQIILENGKARRFRWSGTRKLDDAQAIVQLNNGVQLTIPVVRFDIPRGSDDSHIDCVTSGQLGLPIYIITAEGSIAKWDGMIRYVGICFIMPAEAAAEPAWKGKIMWGKDSVPFELIHNFYHIYGRKFGDFWDIPQISISLEDGRQWDNIPVWDVRLDWRVDGNNYGCGGGNEPLPYLLSVN